MATNLNLTDMESCYKAFRREVIEKVSIEENRFGFEPEIVAKVARLRCRIYEVGISYRAELTRKARRSPGRMEYGHSGASPSTLARGPELNESTGCARIFKRRARRATLVRKGAFIGSGATILANVSIGENALTGRAVWSRATCPPI